MGIDKVKLRAFSPAADQFVESLDAAVKYADLSTDLRLCHFLAQVAHESGGFKAVVENLNYGAAGLRATWPKRFTDVEAAAYARKPEKIANRVYADRMGNGPEASGEGWKYRGRGLLQLTGKDNYRRCSLALYNDARLLENPDLLMQSAGAAMGAAWFWKANSLNKMADRDDVFDVTRIINGGTHGLDDRKARLALAKKLWSVS
jgi:putative chitinase